MSSLRQYLFLWMIAAAFVGIFLSCSGTDKEIIAKVGSQELNRRGLEAIARVPWDSISAEQKWKIAREWAEQRLIEIEAKNKGFDKDPQLVAQLNAIKSELYRSKLLAQHKSAAISDSALQAYYQIHKKEFLRRKDSFLLEIYYADRKNTLADFSKQTIGKDSVNMDLWDEVVEEGRWWAETGELEKLVESELETLKPLQYTEPRAYEDGFRTLKLIQTYKAGEQVDLEDVKNEILQRLLLEESRRRLDKLVEDMKQKTPVSFMLPDSAENKIK